MNDEEKLRRTLGRKASRYGTLDRPFVIAIMGMSSFLDKEDVEGALFGSVAYQYQVERPHIGRWIRNRDGLWMRGLQPRATRVSAVLVGITTSPWNHANELPRLWINPWAQHPLPETENLPAATSNERGAISYTEADMTAYDLFGLPEGWPAPNG